MFLFFPAGETLPENAGPAGSVHYDMRSCYASALGGMDGYLLGKEFLLEDIVRFVREEKYRIYGERCV